MSAARWSLRASAARLTLAVLLTLVLAAPAAAIQLHWEGGSSDLTVTQNTQAVLVVKADSAEAVLPGSWQLVWVADSSGIGFVASDSALACQADTARVFAIELPLTAADSAANLITARLCSNGASFASTGYWLLNLVGASRGKLKVVATNPVSGAPIESNQATFNGGIDGAYPSVALAAASSHATNQFVVHAAGSGLSQIVEVMVQAPDSLWSLPLQIAEQSDSGLTAAAEVYASMPASILRMTNADGAVSVAPLAADGQREGIDLDFEALADSCRLHHCYYFDPDSNVYPKDFTFVYAVSQNPLRGLFHLFYIREFRNVPPTSSSRSFGHAWSSDLRNWESDTSAAVFSVSDHDWDRAHIWAPSIVQVGPNYHMFYTGIDQPDLVYGNQRIGYATATAIDTGHVTQWERRSEPTYTVNNTGWAWRDSTTRRQQFRDPFVMADPDSEGRYLLFVVGEKQDGDYAVGVARNKLGSLDEWEDLGYYRSTEYGNSGNGQVVESVTAFPDSAYPRSETSAQATWRLLFTHGIDSPADSSIRFSTKKLGRVLADTSLGPQEDRFWTTPATNLFTYLGGDSTAWGTYATEYLRAGQVNFLATFDGAGILVSRMVWNGKDFALIQPAIAAADGGTSERGSRVALRVVEALPGTGRLAFEIGMPNRERVRLSIYDVAGRRVRTLVDGEIPTGTVRVHWDGKDQAGYAARSGIYFARLSSEFGSQVVRAAFIR